VAVQFQDFSVTYRTKDGSAVNVGGKLFFYSVGTTTLKSIFDGTDEATEIANPITLDSSGLLPTAVFLNGTYRLVIKEAPDATTGLSITVIDYPIIGGTTGAQFEAWDATISYSINDIRLATDGRFYKSRINSNINNDPANFGNPTEWTHIEFQLATNVLSGGGALTAQVVNILTDGSTYTLPSAASVGINEDLIVEVPERYSAFTPTVQRDGTDTITASTGTDTSIIFETLNLQSLRFTSDGSSTWSI